ncbi:hypothetical protein [Cellulophaga lytica]|uniref:hypothetical protein n=1 Tax=Cellulophaga lytica TaxID=979 RepID=UPI003CE49F4E
MNTLTKAQVLKINTESLAIKHNCTSSYVRLVLKGERSANTKKAKAILEDGASIIEILEGETEKTNV